MKCLLNPYIYRKKKMSFIQPVYEILFEDSILATITADELMTKRITEMLNGAYNLGRGRQEIDGAVYGNKK